MTEAIGTLDRLFSFVAARRAVARAEITASAGRIPGLDGLRALSILIVVGGHFFLPDAGGVAAIGVYIFFAISGFLITRLMYLEKNQNGAINVPKFYARRILRLYPVLIIYLLIVSLIDIIAGQPNDITEIFAVLFYFINYVMTYDIVHYEHLKMAVGVLWSLSVEEHFYLIMPLVFMATRGRVKPMLIFAGTFCVLPLVLRIAYCVFWPEIIGRYVIYVQSETRFDSIAVGVVLAIACQTVWRQRVVDMLSRPLVVAIGMVMILVPPLVPNDIFKETLRFTLMSAGCIPLIVATVFGPGTGLLARVADAPILVWIGKLSYSLYIWHGAVSYFYDLSSPGLAPIVAGILKTASSFALAAVSYYGVEMPIGRLRKYLH